MKGGLGSAAIQMPDGLIVAALVAVNAYGDVIHPATGKVVAGIRTPDGKSLADARVLLTAGGLQPRAGRQHDDRRGGHQRAPVEGRHQPHRPHGRRRAGAHDQSVAHDRRRRRCSPWRPTAGPVDSSASIIGALAADVLAEAIVRAVRHERCGGLPSARALGTAPARIQSSDKTREPAPRA